MDDANVVELVDKALESEYWLRCALSHMIKARPEVFNKAMESNELVAWQNLEALDHDIERIARYISGRTNGDR